MYTYNNLISDALLIFNRGAIPFVESKLKAKFEEHWQENIGVRDHSKTNGEIEWDTQAIADVLIRNWKDIFSVSSNLGPNELSVVHRIKNEARNDWAHQRVFTFDKAYRGLDDMQIILTKIGAPEANEIGKLRAEARKINNEKEFGKPDESLLQSHKAVVVEARPTTKASANGLDERPEFLAELVTRLKKERPGLTYKAGPTKDPYWSFGSGRSGFDYGWAFRPNGTLVAEVYMEPPNSKPKAAFNALKKQQNEIDSEYGKPLIWQLNEGKKASRVYTQILFTITDAPTRQEEVKKWAVESLIKLHTIFQKRIITLDF